MFTLSSIKHPAFAKAESLLKPAGRLASGCYLGEGEEFAVQALNSTAEIEAIYALTPAAERLKPLCEKREIKLYACGTGLMNKLIGTGYETSIAAITMVKQRLITLDDLINQKGIILVCENLQDPRNVGVLIRTAEAVGCSALVLTTDSADPFSRQAVRSTTGSILRLPLHLTSDLPALITEMLSKDINVVTTSAKAHKSVFEADLSRRPLAIVLGNESSGISDKLKKLNLDLVSLPMSANGASSLNVTVAAGALLYEAVRQGTSK